MTQGPAAPAEGIIEAPPASVGANPVLEVIGGTRAIRRLRPDAVPTGMVDALVWGATRAASPNNTQLWQFIVVTDPDRRIALGDILGRFAKWVDRLPPPESGADARIRHEARHLIVNIASAPVLIFVCAEHTYPVEEPDPRYVWSTIGGAAQNLIVTARALGLGATLTMMHVGSEKRVRDLLAVPDHVVVGALIPVGWPQRPFGPVRRRPVAEVTHYQQYRERREEI